MQSTPSYLSATYFKLESGTVSNTPLCSNIAVQQYLIWQGLGHTCCKQVVEEVYEETAQMGLTLKTPLAHGILATPQQDNHIYRVEAAIWFPQVYATAFILYLFQAALAGSVKPPSLCCQTHAAQACMHNNFL